MILSLTWHIAKGRMMATHKTGEVNPAHKKLNLKQYQVREPNYMKLVLAELPIEIEQISNDSSNFIIEQQSHGSSEKWEVTISNKKIGEGTFGSVFKAVVTQGDDSINFAVKSPKNEVGQRYLIKELRMLEAINNIEEFKMTGFYLGVMLSSQLLLTTRLATPLAEYFFNQKTQHIDDPGEYTIVVLRNMDIMQGTFKFLEDKGILPKDISTKNIVFYGDSLKMIDMASWKMSCDEGKSKSFTLNQAWITIPGVIARCYQSSEQYNRGRRIISAKNPGDVAQRDRLIHEYALYTCMLMIATTNYLSLPKKGRSITAFEDAMFNPFCKKGYPTHPNFGRVNFSEIGLQISACLSKAEEISSQLEFDLSAGNISFQP